MPDLNSIESHVNKRSLAEAGIFSLALVSILLLLYLPYLSGQRCFLAKTSLIFTSRFAAILVKLFGKEEFPCGIHTYIVECRT